MEAIPGLSPELYGRVAVCAFAVWAVIAAARAAFGLKLNSSVARRVFPVVALVLGIGLMFIPAALPADFAGGAFDKVVLGLIAGALASHGRTSVRRIAGKGISADHRA